MHGIDLRAELSWLCTGVGGAATFTARSTAYRAGNRGVNRGQPQGDGLPFRGIPLMTATRTFAAHRTSTIARRSPCRHLLPDSEHRGESCFHRDELLNGEIFQTMTEAKVLVEQWRQHYNTIRPHSSLGYKPPAPVAWSPGRSDPAFATGVLRPDRPFPQSQTLIKLWHRSWGQEMIDRSDTPCRA